MADDLQTELIPSDEEILEARVGSGSFVDIGQSFVDTFVRDGLLQPDSTFIDIGCGLGRIARPLVGFFSERGKYVGYDNKSSTIDWCKEKYRKFSKFEFRHLDAQNGFYNPSGRIRADQLRFPLRDNSADFVSLVSVFVHMWPKDVAAYLKEVSRLLKPGQNCFVSGFVIDPESAQKLDFADLPEPILGAKSWHKLNGCYSRSREVPESLILHDELALRRMYADAGMEIVAIRYGGWLRQGRGPAYGKVDSQDTIIAKKVSGSRRY